MHSLELLAWKRKKNVLMQGESTNTALYVQKTVQKHKNSFIFLFEFVQIKRRGEENVVLWRMNFN